ncbi:hypothetical protein SELMODRAFT_102801 [Selaginella moellendorffii]|uniref:Uncharacterized protein n=1 Tax=Selaginella moellendorffii TaxID=88036 RepID=D8RVP2_SELML|nr:uncharacterized protein LOC9638146 [Selaginella moellendorffii]EFJ23811.1 hypothetical protein SELMODRAFT_102801 [Selaginella moellendorffii]|eukprot:XP_002975026.1 uncharacterized protein LOC9638146 [Selaginella moellendorffii]
MAPPALRLPRHSSGDDTKCRPALLLIAVSACAAIATYFALSPLFQPDQGAISSDSSDGRSARHLVAIREEKAACCRGIEHQELWGSVVQWGTSNKVNSSAACCQACKAAQCNSWVYCGDRVKCGPNFGECWLKNQEDPLSPDVQDSSKDVYWTSGLVYAKNVGLVQLETEYGAIRLQLLPDCAPLSVAFVIELLKLRHCAGCNIYRAETRGNSWDEEGNPTAKNLRGPPHAILQGTLEAEGLGFKELPREACPMIRRGMVGWIEGGPDFFISLANHDDWYPKHTVFANVLPDDLPLVEKLASLPTSKTIWSGIDVAVLKKPISLKLARASVASS